MSEWSVACGRRGDVAQRISGYLVSTVRHWAQASEHSTEARELSTPELNRNTLRTHGGGSHSSYQQQVLRGSPQAPFDQRMSTLSLLRTVSWRHFPPSFPSIDRGMQLSRTRHKRESGITGFMALADPLCHARAMFMRAL